MNRKVKYLKAHSVIFMGGGVGSLGETLPPSQKAVDLDMTATEIGVIVVAKVKSSPTRAGGSATGLIPYGNIQIALLADEEAPSPQADAKAEGAKLSVA